VTAVETRRARLAESPWASLVPKLALWIGAFVALAAVGSGAASGLFPRSSHEAPALATMLPPGLVTAPAEAADAGAAVGDAAAPPPALTADGKVILNLASEADLRRLPGIGPTRAKRILEQREKQGKFKKIEDLLKVKGIGRRAVGRLRPLVVLDPPPAA
jgi:competence protein ComEA